MRMLEEAESRGYYDTEGLVCSTCIDDEALRDAIRIEGSGQPCDYCGATPAGPEATVDLERVVQLVTEGLQYEYEDPTDVAGWNSREGGFLVATWDLDELLGEHEVTSNCQLANDIASAITLDTWCQYDPYAASPGEALKWGWGSFRNYVKHQRRYTFLTRDASTHYAGNELSMDQVPAAIVDAIADAGQRVSFPAGTVWWRARVHQATGESHSTPGALGTPPDVYARDNRMSPKGIGAFYGASTAAGAQAEVAGYADSDQDATLGCFTQFGDLELVDLRERPAVPSLFDADRRHLRGPIEFIRGFIDDITAVAAPGEDQVLEYVPTQVIAEHLRYDLPADGIVWRSTKDPDVFSCVLFLPNSAMTSISSGPDPDSPTPQVGLDPDTVRFLSAPLG